MAREVVRSAVTARAAWDTRRQDRESPASSRARAPEAKTHQLARRFGWGKPAWARESGPGSRSPQVPTSGVILPKYERRTPTTAARAVRIEVTASVRPTACGMPGRPIMSEVTAKSATSMATPRSLAGPGAGRGEATRSDTSAQPR